VLGLSSDYIWIIRTLLGLRSDSSDCLRTSRTLLGKGGECKVLGNVLAIYCELELSHRISHANHHLNRIWDLIAEKSFQYSHVICVAPRKAVNTQSRAAVKKLNLEIALHCQLYSQCQTQLLRLGADLATQSQFRVLTPDDVKASTAIVNPNEPSSTQLKLSWIWQTAGGHRLGLVATESQSSANASANAGPGADVNILECKYWLHFLI